MRTAIALVLSGTSVCLVDLARAQPAPAPVDAEPAPGVDATPGVDPTAPTVPDPVAPTPPAEPAPAPASSALARSIGIDGAIVVPMSDYADDAKIGFGAFGRVEFPRSEQFAFTLRAGALVHVPADDRDTLVLVPAFVGLQFAFARPWFVAVDAGMAFRYAGKAEAAVGLAFGGGYRSGKFSARAEFLVPDLGTADSTAGVLATVGYSP